MKFITRCYSSQELLPVSATVHAERKAMPNAQQVYTAPKAGDDTSVSDRKTNIKAGEQSDGRLGRAWPSQRGQGGGVPARPSTSGKQLQLKLRRSPLRESWLLTVS